MAGRFTCRAKRTKDPVKGSFVIIYLENYIHQHTWRHAAVELVVTFACTYASNSWVTAAATKAAYKSTTADDDHQQDEQHKNCTDVIETMAKS